MYTATDDGRHRDAGARGSLGSITVSEQVQGLEVLTQPPEESGLNLFSPIRLERSVYIGTVFRRVCQFLRRSHRSRFTRQNNTSPREFSI